MRTGKLTNMALLCAVALIIHILESMLPELIPIPGVKPGLANIVTVFAVFVLGPGQAMGILAGRIFLASIFAGNFSSFFYAAGGGLLAILATIALRRVLQNNQIWIAGCLGAVMHSVGQLAVAVFIGGTWTVLLYLPVLIVCSIIAGLFTGLCAQVLIKRGEKLWKTFLK